LVVVSTSLADTAPLLTSRRQSGGRG